MPADQELSLFEKILLATDGTVTDLIALYAGETIRVKKLDQFIERRDAPPALRCHEPTRMLQRRILLAGAARHYLYAESQFVLERFSAHLQQQLLETDTPVGMLWKEARLETYREITAKTIEAGGEIARHFELPPDTDFVSRTYLIHYQGLPLGSITEKWPVGWFRD